MKSVIDVRWVKAVAGVITVSVILIVASPVALAQGAPTERNQRATRDGRPQQRFDVRAVRALQRAVPQELDLAADQARVINDLFDAYLERIKEAYRRIKEERDANAERAGALRRQLIEARRAKDAERVREIHNEMQGLAANRSALQSTHREFDKKIIAELNEEQAVAYRKLAARLRGRSGGSIGVFRSIGSMRKILSRLNLSDDQNARVRDLMRSLAQSFSDVRSGDRDGEVVVAEFRDQVLDVLDDDQRARFIEIEKDVAKGKKSAGERPRRERLDVKRRPDGD